MPLPVTATTAATFAPPVMQARRWLAETTLPPDLPLLNLSQAAPVDPPPGPLRAAMAQAVAEDPGLHLYAPVLGIPALRAALARQTAALYRGAVSADQVAITAGCNQAFCAALAALAGRGDEVIIPVPWYFNHAMWLSLQGITPRPLPCGPGLLPDPEDAARLITPATRAIVLVSPNNPGGVEYPPALIDTFADLAARHGLALILDETYRDFHTSDGPPHGLFARPGWDEVLVHLYSFSKAYRLTGHRVGAIIAARPLLAEIEKFLDTVAICAPGPGQMGALWGLENLGDWLAGERQEILRRRAAAIAGIARLPGWELQGCGAYFAWLRHPFQTPSPQLARDMLARRAVLMLPGTMFRPSGDAAGNQELRLAFANADCAQLDDLIIRLADL